MILFVDFWRFTKIYDDLQKNAHKIVFVLTFVAEPSNISTTWRNDSNVSHWRKPSARKPKLTDFQRVNTREKPFACDVCGKAFSLQTYTPKNHQSVITGTKQFFVMFVEKPSLLRQTWPDISPSTLDPLVLWKNCFVKGALCSHTKT